MRLHVLRGTGPFQGLTTEFFSFSFFFSSSFFPDTVQVAAIGVGGA